jgi:amidase
MLHADYLRLDATALAAKVAQGEATPAELLANARAQLARVQPPAARWPACLSC